MASAAAQPAGTTVFVENIFESRYRHVPELVRMGAEHPAGGPGGGGMRR